MLAVATALRGCKLASGIDHSATNVDHKAGITAAHAPNLARQLAALNVAREPSDMNLHGWGLHPLKRKLVNHWRVSVSGNWRLTFTFNDGDAELVDCQDYQ